MDQLSSHSRKLLLEAVRSAEDAAIQLRQYTAARLPPVWEFSEIYGDADSPASIEVTTESWLRIELPCVMPRREDNDRSRFLAGLLRNAIHRAFPKHDQPRFRTCVLVYEHIYDLSQSRRFIDHDNIVRMSWKQPFWPTIPQRSALRFNAVIEGHKTAPAFGY